MSFSRRCLPALALLVLGAACGPAARPAMRTARSRGPVASETCAAASATPVRRGPPRGEIAVLPSEPAGRRDRALWWEAPGSGDSRNVVVGGLRVAVTGDVLVWAPGRFVDSIVAVARTDAGFVFASEGGAIARAAEFTGALERVGETGEPLERGAAPVSVGVLCVVDAHGAVRISDGRSPPRMMSGAPHGRARFAAFTSARDGAVVMDGGALFVTRDAGASFHAVDLGADAAVGLEVRDGTLAVRLLDGGLRAVDATGTLGAAALAPGGEPADRDEAERARFTRRLGRAMIGRDPGVLERDYATGGVRRGDGTLVVPDGRDVRIYDRATGHEVDTRVGTLPVAGCALRAWGDGLAALCPTSTPGETALYHSLDGERFTDVNTRWRGAEPVFSDDELHAVRRGPCDPAGPRGADDAAVCVFHAEHAEWRDASLGDPDVVPLAAHGDSLLVARRLEETRFAAPELYDLESGERTPLRLPPSQARASWELRSARFLADGTLVAVAAQQATDATGGAGDVALWTGAADQELSVLPLPRGARTVDLADADHGLAAGADFAAVWRTADGGISWQPLSVPVRGAPAAARLSAGDAEVRVRCDAFECDAGERVRVRGWGALRPPRELALAPEAPPGDVRTELGAAPGHSDFECEGTSPPGVIPSRSRRAAPAPAGLTTTPVATENAVAWLDAEPGDGGALPPRVRLHWQRASGPNGFDASTRAAPLALPDAGGVWSLRAADRRAALLERCDDGPHPACAWYWASAGGGLVSLSHAAGFGPYPSDGPGAIDAVRAEDGSVLVLARETRGPLEVDRVARLGRDGHRVVLATYAWPRGTTTARALGAWEGRAGLLTERVTRSGATLWFDPLRPGDAARETRRVLPRDGVRACALPAEPRAALVRLVQDRDVSPVHLGAGHGASATLRIELEVREGGACVRGIAARVPGVAAPEAWSSLSAGAGGALVGAWPPSHGTTPVRCTRAP